MSKALCTLLMLALGAGARAQEAAPTQDQGAIAEATVARLQDGLIDLMRSNAASAERAAAADRLLMATHDLPYIARIVLGRHWRELDAEQQASFLKAFEALSVANYTARFRSYAGEHFDTPRTLPDSGAEHSVRSVLTTASGAEHEFVYLLHATDTGWRIVNIVVDGVSDLALKRAEYGRLMDAGGFDALLAALDAQIEHLQARGAADT